jgi:hypothetical protein
VSTRSSSLVEEIDVDRRRAMEWSWVAIIAMTVLCIPGEASAEEWVPFSSRIESDDSPTCFEVSAGPHTEEVLPATLGVDGP